MRSDLTGCRDPKVVQVDQAQMDQRVTQVQLVLLGSQEVQDFRGCQEREEYQDHLAPKETQALSETKDRRGKLELTARGVFLDLLDLLVLEAQTERRVNLDHQDRQDAEEPEEHLGLQVRPVQLVLLASKELLVQTVSPGSKVKQVSRV